MVKALPNTSFLPVPKSAPAGHTTAAAHLLWQVFPRYPCLEYKDYSGQSCPVRYTWTASFGRRLMFWQKWFNLTPQFVAYQFPGHLLHPPLVFYCIFLYLSGFVRCSKEGILYLSIIYDLYDRSIVAYKTGTSQTVNLVLDTIHLAMRSVKTESRRELQLHSDQGFQYTSQAYFNLTREYNITPSMSRRGNCYDNALV